MARNRDPRIEFGKAVRALRLTLELSQIELAEKANLHFTYIGSVERGERNISLLNIVKIACALETTPASLLAKVSCS